jgi:hypothetical protein
MAFSLPCSYGVHRPTSRQEFFLKQSVHVWEILQAASALSPRKGRCPRRTPKLGDICGVYEEKKFK